MKSNTPNYKQNELNPVNQPVLESDKFGKDKMRLAVKAIVGALLILYVLRSKMIDFHSLQSLLLKPTGLVFSLAFLAFAASCCAFRWYLLIRAQGLSLSLKDTFELTMIGFFFNTFMPGAVGGDLIKAWYAAGQEPRRKTKAIFTVLLDRALGLWVFFLVAATALALHAEWLKGHPQLQLLAYSIWSITGGSLLFLLLYYASTAWKVRAFTPAITWVRRSPKLANLMDTALLHRETPSAIAFALLLSTISILSNLVLFKFLGNALNIPMTLSQYAFVIPVALTVSAVPILPGGLGVGQVAFFTLFQWVGMEDPSQGGALCTLFQVYTLLFNCMGAIFYLKFKRKPLPTAPVGEPQINLS